MPAAAIAAAAIASAAASAYAASKSAKAATGAASTQSDAAQYAANLQAQTAKNALNLQKQQYGNTLGMMTPWVQIGQGAAGKLAHLAGVTPSTWQPTVPTQETNPVNMAVPRVRTAPPTGPAPALPRAAGTVVMRSPNGSTRAVTQSQVPYYLSKGAQVVSNG